MSYLSLAADVPNIEDETYLYSGEEDIANDSEMEEASEAEEEEMEEEEEEMEQGEEVSRISGGDRESEIDEPMSSGEKTQDRHTVLQPG